MMLPCPVQPSRSVIRGIVEKKDGGYEERTRDILEPGVRVSVEYSQERGKPPASASIVRVYEETPRWFSAWAASGARAMGSLRPECALHGLHIELPGSMRAPEDRRVATAKIFGDLILYIWREQIETGNTGRPVSAEASARVQ